MTTQEQYIERLKELVSAKYGRRPSTEEEFTELAQIVAEKTAINLEIASLKHLFAPVTRNSVAPRPITLSTLARYVGYAGWADFCTARDVLPANDTELIPVTHRWGVMLLTISAVVVVIITAIVLLRGNKEEVTVSESMEAVEAVYDRFAPVKEEWTAATTEYCNALREYYDESNIDGYITHVEGVNKEYISQLRANIERDIARYAVTNNITIDDATIARTADAIALICERMCDNLLVEARAVKAAAAEDI